MTSITNLLLLAGGDDVLLQPLDAAITDYKAANSRNPTRLTFCTEQPVGVSMRGGGAQIRTERMGLILWFDREKVGAALKVSSPEGVAPDAYRRLLNLQLTLLEAQQIQGGQLPGPEAEAIETLRTLLESRLGSMKPV